MDQELYKMIIGFGGIILATIALAIIYPMWHYAFPES